MIEFPPLTPGDATEVDRGDFEHGPLLQGRGRPKEGSRVREWWDWRVAAVVLFLSSQLSLVFGYVEAPTLLAINGVTCALLSLKGKP